MIQQMTSPVPVTLLLRSLEGSMRLVRPKVLEQVTECLLAGHAQDLQRIQAGRRLMSALEKIVGNPTSPQACRLLTEAKQSVQMLRVMLGDDTPFPVWAIEQELARAVPLPGKMRPRTQWGINRLRRRLKKLPPPASLRDDLKQMRLYAKLGLALLSRADFREAQRAFQKASNHAHHAEKYTDYIRWEEWRLWALGLHQGGVTAMGDPRPIHWGVQFRIAAYTDYLAGKMRHAEDSEAKLASHYAALGFSYGALLATQRADLARMELHNPPSSFRVFVGFHRIRANSLLQPFFADQMPDHETAAVLLSEAAKGCSLYALAWARQWNDGTEGEKQCVAVEIYLKAGEAALEAGRPDLAKKLLAQAKHLYDNLFIYDAAIDIAIARLERSLKEAIYTK